MVYLIVGLLENINSNDFEIYIFDDTNSYNKNDRIFNCCKNYYFVGSKTDAELAEHIYNLNIDILIDLMGLTSKVRIGTFALRPCEYIINFLGFPGSCGSSKVDYILSDKIVTPDSSKQFYSEKLCRMPECFMPNDNKRGICKNEFLSRKDFDLPEDGVIFCSFNRPFKIDFSSVNLWMRIISQVDNSFLWQKTDDPIIQQSILDIAKKYNVQNRIIFAKNVAFVEFHLFRASFADLALDTLIYNGHSITADMLWAGVPVITCKGNHFASRVSESLLNSIGLNECVGDSVEDMERIAIDLGNNKNKIAYLKNKLNKNKNLMPLFDTERYARHFEIAMKTIKNQKKIDHIDIMPLPSKQKPFEINTNLVKDFIKEYADQYDANKDLQTESYKCEDYSLYFNFCPVCNSFENENDIKYLISATHNVLKITSRKNWLFCKNCNHFYSDSYFDEKGNSIFEKTFLEENNDLSLVEEILHYKNNDFSDWFIVNPKNVSFIIKLLENKIIPLCITNLQLVYEEINKLNIACSKINFLSDDFEFSNLSLFCFDYFPFPDLVLSKIYNSIKEDSLFHLSVHEFEHENILGNVEIYDPFRKHMYTENEIFKVLQNHNFSIINKISDKNNSKIKHYILKKLVI